MRIILACLLAIFFAFFAFNSVYAQNKYNFPEASGGEVNKALVDAGHHRILPSSPLYPLISIKESVLRFFTSSSLKRAQYDILLSSKRLKETYLLAEKGDYKNASKNFARYNSRVEKMINQIEKARSQNQDVRSSVSLLADKLQAHEVLLYAAWQKRPQNNDFSYDENFDKAYISFISAINAINTIQPGVKNRYKSASESADLVQESPVATPTPSPVLSGTSSASPFKILY